MRKGLFFLFLIIVGCKSKPQPLPPPDSSGDELILETATVNLGEAPGVIRLATPRILAVAEELSKMDEFGVICIQELWIQEHKDAVIKALGPDVDVYQESTRGENQRDGVNVCSPRQVKNVVSCVVKNKCGYWPSEEQTICVLEQCHKELRDVFLYGGAECLHCLVASVGKSVEGVMDTCVQHDDQTPVVGASRAYDGQNGVLLASRWPLQNKEVLRLRASFSNRVALFATIEPPGYGPIEVACAHISTSGTGIPPNHPDFSNWDEEMIAQIEAISKRLKERAVDNRPSLFLGDMNAGMARDGNISQEMPMVWKRIVELGFYSPATDADPAFCSICASNTLRIKLTDPYQRPAKNNTLIDHVLVRDPPGGMRLEPILAYPFFNQLRKFKGYNGELVEQNLSDHYGVIVNFRLHQN